MTHKLSRKIRNIDFTLIGFQDRVLGAPRLRPVGLALVLFRGLTDDLFDVFILALRFLKSEKTEKSSSPFSVSFV